MWRKWITVFGLLTLTYLPCSHAQFRGLEKKTKGEPESVSTVLSVDLATAVRAIELAFSSRTGQTENKFDHFRLAKAGSFYFPDDVHLKKYATNDTLARRYLALPSAQRKNDFSLVAFPDYYWHSEYYYENSPADFRCNFVIHVEPAGDSGTTIEIIEYQAQVKLGKKIGFSAHTGPVPAIMEDVREVSSTESDRRELLEVIKESM